MDTQWILWLCDRLSAEGSVGMSCQGPRVILGNVAYPFVDHLTYRQASQHVQKNAVALSTYAHSHHLHSVKGGLSVVNVLKIKRLPQTDSTITPFSLEQMVGLLGVPYVGKHAFGVLHKEGLVRNDVGLSGGEKAKYRSYQLNGYFRLFDKAIQMIGCKYSESLCSSSTFDELSTLLVP